MPGEGEDFCGQVFLRTGGGVAGHEFTVFLHDPDAVEDPARVLETEARDDVPSDRLGLWWTSPPDSLQAWIAGEGRTVWELRLGRGAFTLDGTLRQVLPVDAPDVAPVSVLRTACPAEIRPPPGND